MIRFVLGPTGEVVPDIARKLPGRGAWVRAASGDVEAAAKKGAFSRAFKMQAKAPDDLADRVGEGLRARALSYLSFAAKAGVLVLGFEKVRARLKAGDIAVLVTASDGGEDGIGKLWAAAEAGAKAAAELRHVACFTREELNLALGRTNVVHAALRNHGLGDQFVDAASQYAGYKGIPLSSRQNQAA